MRDVGFVGDDDDLLEWRHGVAIRVYVLTLIWMYLFEEEEEQGIINGGW